MTVEELTEHERFAILRKRAGLRQEEVAAEAQVSRPYVSLYESGKTSVSGETVERLWEALERMRRDSVA